MPSRQTLYLYLTRIGCIIVMILGGIVMKSGIRSVWNASASTSWPTVSARVVSSTVNEHRHEHREQRSSKRRSAREAYTSISYSAIVTYQYIVDGKSYLSKRISYDSVSSTPESFPAEEIAARYPEGAELTISYKPSNPATSVIHPGLNQSAHQQTVVGLVIFSIGGLVLLCVEMINYNRTATYP